MNRFVLHCLAAVATVSIAALPNLPAAQTFPSKPLKIVVPNAPGGAADITARTVGQKLSEALGQPVIIENKPSAGGVVAGEQVAKAEADGHTLLLVSSGTAVSAALFKALPFDTRKDFAAVSKLASFDLAIAVADDGKGGRFKTFAEMLAYARANPGKLNVGTPQVGTTQNLAAEYFKNVAGIDVQVVPFNGTPPVIAALRGGSIDAMVDILGALMPQINGRSVRPLVLLGDKRATQLPDVPVAHEAGGALGQFSAASWNGLAVPAKTSKDVIARLNRELVRILALPDVRQKLADLTLVAESSTPEQLAATLERDIVRWSGVIGRARIPRQ
ncbi:MAG: tripartite tricarboxylate transporter substrate binding protein [Burkholderiales bacterium]|nr:tripartite tricarboxylate transporter substrate binding protein [Burkholderiales bacterium]